MDIKSLRKHIQEVVATILTEVEQPKYFIKYSKNEGEFVLYKRFFGLDQYDNPNEQIAVVKLLGGSPKKAEVLAKQITGQDLEAKKPVKSTPAKRGEMIMPVSTYKGKKIKEIPIEYLVGFVLHNKWMNIINKDPYIKNIYEYLTQNIPAKTQKYFAIQIKGTSTPDLIEKYNEYKKFEYVQGSERIAFSKMLMPLLKSELEERRVQ